MKLRRLMLSPAPCQEADANLWERGLQRKQQKNILS